MGIRVEAVSAAVLADGQKVVRELGLLTNDATIVAIMRRMGVRHLVTNDTDFDALPGITVWKPG
jgi:predicted nucleic acid-binding protein